MRDLINSLFSAIRARFIGLWTRLRYWTSPTWWRTQGISRLRVFFSRLVDVKPRNKDDYYPLWRWLVSKKLAFAILVALGIASAYYISMVSPLSISGTPDDPQAAIPTYRFNSLALKFKEGTVRILAADKTVAYVGEVAGGCAAGQGSLYNAEGELVYTGSFENNMFSGPGKLYYPDGVMRYEGEFAKNLYNGEGKAYRPGGGLLYSGQYQDGLRSGAGELYDASGNKVFTGSFLLDQLQYAEFLGKSTPDAAQMYTGRQRVYQSEDEYCVEMVEIGAVYRAASGADALDEEWSVESVLVLDSAVSLFGQELTTINELSDRLGQPLYFGSTWVDLAEAAACNLLPEDAQLGNVRLTGSQPFEDVTNVTEYDRNHEIYIYTFVAEDLLYTFYCPDGGAAGFSMYAIERVQPDDAN